MSVDMSDVFLTWGNSLKSRNTYKAYNKSVKLFCNLVFDKEPQLLTKENLLSLRYSTTLNHFVIPLRDRGVKDSTIKSHLTAMRSYVKMMRREKLFSELDYSTIIEDALTIKELNSKDVEHHEAMSLEELHQMEEWLHEKNHKSGSLANIGDKYAMLIDFMFKTAVRVSATFNIEWNNFNLLTSPYGGKWAKLEVIDKGHKLNTKYLTQKYYYELKKLFYKGNNNDRVFEDLSKSTLRGYFKEYSNKVGRNLVVHSLKAGAATTLYEQTKDLLMVRDFLDHESVTTTEGYIHNQVNPNQTGTAILTSSYNYDNLNNLSKEQLLMLIHSKPEIENMVYLSAIQHKVKLDS